MNNKVAKILANDGRLIEATILFSKSPPWKIELLINGEEKYKAEASDLFEALAIVRKEAFNDNISVLCNGARKDVYPSSMSRNMAGGVAAYQLKLGQESTRSDLVNIFDPADKDLIGTVEEQREYYCLWLKSLGKLQNQQE